jgi:hypothetical protein
MKLAVESKKNCAVVMCVHVQTHNHLEGFSSWKDRASVHIGLTVPSNSILVDNVFYLFLFIYLFILFIYGSIYDAVSVTDYVMSYGWMYGE